jgi:O-antigen/teichoic acid export membrane protein
MPKTESSLATASPSLLIRRTLFYLPAQIVGPVVQFAAILVFTHWMMPGAYGVFTYVLASQDFVFLLSLSWWSQYTVRFLGDHAADQDDSYSVSELSIVAGTVLLQIVVALLALRLIAPQISTALAVATGLYTVTRCITLHLAERARAQHLVFDYTLAQSAGPIAGFALAYALVAFAAATPEAALFGYGIAQAIILVWLAARQDIRYVLRWPDAELMRRAFSFGLPLIAAGLAAWCGMNAIRILVDHKMGAEAMGLIAVGWGLGNRLTATASMLVTVAAYPLAVESLRAGSRAQAFAQITSNGLLMFAILLPATVGLFLLQRPVVDLLVAEPFRAMTLAVLPAALAAGLFRNIRTHVADQAFVLDERTGMVCGMTVVEALLAIAGCVVGLEIDGAPGATLGSAVGYGVALIISFAAARARAGLLLPWRDAGLVILAVAIMAVVLRLLPDVWLAAAAPPVSILIRLVVGAATYLVAMLVFFPTIARHILSQWRGIAFG